MIVTPAVLAHSEQDAHDKLFHAGLRKVAPLFHIDVLDGTMFGASCFADPAIIGSWPDLPEIEIHLMVSDPMFHAVQWKKFVPGLKRAIVHQETPRDVAKIIEQIKLMQLEVSLAISPKTPFDYIPARDALLLLRRGSYGGVDELLIMGVHPGQSGQAFLGESILSKIRRAKMLYPAMPIAVDGGVNTKVIHELALAGATRFIASSALWSSAHPEEALDELTDCAMMNT